MAINYSGLLVAELRAKQAAGVPYRTLAEEYGLSRGTIFGLIHGQHRVRTETAQQALTLGRQGYWTPLMVDSRYDSLGLVSIVTPACRSFTRHDTRMRARSGLGGEPFRT
jgi:hypothetical protein